MSLIKVRHAMLVAFSVLLACALTGCGFHLRENANLPPSMHRVHLNVSGGGGEFERHLARALQTSGISVEDLSGPGVAELNVPLAAFTTESLSPGGYVRITEQAVHFEVRFNAVNSDGSIIEPDQTISMQREYSYDASDALGNGTQIAQIEKSLQDDMVQAILFRLEAAGKRGSVAPVSASSTR